MENNTEQQEQFDYKAAVAELQEMVEKMEKNEIPFADMPATVKRSSQLLKKCREELRRQESVLLENLQ